MSRDGLPFAAIEPIVLDQESGEPLGPGEVGEYVVRGPSLFMGYLGRPELTAESVREGGYLRTGDLMSIDDLGYVKYVGRLKDVIRRGGVNIDPMEVERVLIQHPGVADVSVVGLPDPRLGETAVAAVETVDGAGPTLAAIVEFLAAREVPVQSHPERLVVVEELPRTEFGKHNKAKLREQLLAGKE
jgi:acyl-CoA synthetase (AMP-forming)/AMP-acid ligase II